MIENEELRADIDPLPDGTVQVSKIARLPDDR